MTLKKILLKNFKVIQGDYESISSIKGRWEVEGGRNSWNFSMCLPKGDYRVWDKAEEMLRAEDDKGGVGFIPGGIHSGRPTTN